MSETPPKPFSLLSSEVQFYLAHKVPAEEKKDSEHQIKLLSQHIQSIDSSKLQAKSLNVLIKILSLLSATSEKHSSIIHPIKSFRQLNFLLQLHPTWVETNLLIYPKRLYGMLSFFTLSPALSLLFAGSLSTEEKENFIRIFPIKKKNVKDFLIEWNTILLSYFSLLEEDKQENSVLTIDLLKDKLEGCKQKLLYYRLCAFAHIAYCEFHQVDSFTETVQKISDVASLCVCYVARCVGIGAEELSIVAMGKWGARELNYSSDIDIIFICAERLTAEQKQALGKKIKHFIALLSDNANGGILFRIDTQIRPEGSAGALFNTLSYYQKYYQNRALVWEIQSLLKARVVFGFLSDEATNRGSTNSSERNFNNFQSLITPLLQKKNITNEVLIKSIHTMKNKIEKNLMVRQNEWGNIKLGAGGIRDIEFIVQFLQLYHGKNNSAILLPDTLTALERLYIYRIITKEEKHLLQKHYMLLRQVEHALQIQALLPVRTFSTSNSAYKDSHSLQTMHLVMKKILSTYDNPQENLSVKLEKVCQEVKTFFYEMFDITIALLQKKLVIKQACLKDLPQSIDNKVHVNETFTSTAEKLVEDYFQHLDSTYFLHKTTEVIHQHIKMLQQLSQENYLLMSIHKHTEAEATKSIYTIDIVTYDILGAFSIISGTLALYSLDLVHGDSYVYDPSTTTTNDNNTTVSYQPLYRQKKNTLQYKKRLSVSKRRKIICTLTCSADASFVLNEEEFKQEIKRHFKWIQEGNIDKASENLLLRLTEGRVPKADISADISPMELQVDNLSDHHYTILNIDSKNAYLFMYEFTNALAVSGYYIGKVIIQTEGDVIRDKLFVTTKSHKKIENDNDIQMLKTTITLIKAYTPFLIGAPNPLLSLRQFKQILNLLRTEAGKRDSLIKQFFNSPLSIQRLAGVLGTNATIWEEVLSVHFEELFPIFFKQNKSFIENFFYPKQVYRKLLTALQGGLDDSTSVYEQDAIRNFNHRKDRAMFYIDMRFQLNQSNPSEASDSTSHLGKRTYPFSRFAQELSVLAVCILRAAFTYALNKIKRRSDFNAKKKLRCALFTLGKLAGKEIGYASDIELMFIYDDQDEQHAFYEKIINSIITCVRSKKNGIFELDLRLRPDGDASPLATSLPRFKAYYTHQSKQHKVFNRQAINFERQALVRLTPVCGDAKLIKDVLTHKNNYIYDTTHPFDVKDMYSLRKKQIDNFVKKDASSLGEVINLKYSEGGLVDAEYLVQALQIQHGAKYRELQSSTNTLQTAHLLLGKNVFTDSDYVVVSTTYQLLRDAINCLRIVRGDAKDLFMPEPNSLEMTYFTRRLNRFSDFLIYSTDVSSTQSVDNPNVVNVSKLTKRSVEQALKNHMQQLSKVMTAVLPPPTAI